ALITGADDIGRAAAILFAKEGAKVALHDIDPAAAQAVAAEVEKAAPGSTLALGGNVAKREDAIKMADETAKKFGKIDIFVYNERIARDAPTKEMAPEQWDQVADVILRGFFHCGQALHKHMVKEEAKDKAKTSTGKIVVVTSFTAILGHEDRLNFTAAQAGLIGSTKMLAKEWGRWKVNVNAVCHGFVDGKLGREKVAPDLLAVSKRARTMLKIPPPGPNLWNRNATPDEIAKPILFLASDDAEYITGETLNVTAGMGAGLI
ncbi:MAG: SDR family oxidoreductase, partial [Euryarchaeota archaeon]|nr:SDR family oxidoreductase [Euryarchaeota archaeon]